MIHTILSLQVLFRTTIAFLAGALIALGPGIHELAKLPGIISHYQHHVQMHGETELGFVDYLVSHFGERDHEDEDHASLPFHGHNTCSGHTMVVLVHHAPVLNTSTSYLPTCESDLAPPTAPQRSIFQPPRV